VLHEDALGELEIRLMGATLAERGTVSYQPPLGWAGDRYRVVAAPEGPALVWYLAFDDAPSAERFRAGIGKRMEAIRRPGYRVTLESMPVGGRDGVRFIIAPEAWSGWAAPPQVAVR
jgi:hypothetical protein